MGSTGMRASDASGPRWGVQGAEGGREERAQRRAHQQDTRARGGATGK